MELEKIRTLLATPAEKLEQVAKKLELPLPVARDIRVQAMNLVLGKCALCGKPTMVGMCSHCKKSAPHRRRIPWSSVKLLKMMKPSDQLLRQLCDRCRKPFMLSAKYLLRKLLLRRSEDTKRTCASCVEKEKAAAQKLKTQEIVEKRRQRLQTLREIVERRRKEQEKRIQEKREAETRSNKKSSSLSHRPFADSKAIVELQKSLPTSPPAKRPKRAKSLKNQGISR